MTAAAGLLARRDFGTAELRDRLERRHFDAAAIDAVVAELTESSFLDDERFARHFVALHGSRGHGPLRIGRELRDRGLADALVTQALDTYGEEQGGWGALAQQLRTRRFGDEAPENWAEKARQARFLLYRGFSNDHIRLALGSDVETNDG